MVNTITLLSVKIKSGAEKGQKIKFLRAYDEEYTP